MPQFVRAGLRTNRWLETEGREPRDLPADLIGDLPTKGNQLSVFEVTDVVSAERIAIAFAAGKANAADTGYSIFDRANVERIGITPIKTDGATYDAAANATHYDLPIGTAGKLLELAAVIANGEIVPILKGRVTELLRTGFENGQLDHTKNRQLCNRVNAQVGTREGTVEVDEER